MDIHPGHAGLIVPLYHTEEFPAIPLIETGMVSDQIDGRDTFGFQILHDRIQKSPRNSLTAVFLFRIDRTYIGKEVFPVMKIVFRHAKAARDAASVKSEIPSILRFLADVSFHTFSINALRHSPFCMKPGSYLLHQFWSLSQINII